MSTNPIPAVDLPLVAWGDPDDISTYTQVGTCTVTGSQADPFGGTGAYLLNDTDAGAVSYRYAATAPVSGTTVPVEVFIKQGTSTSVTVRLYDTTAGAARFWSLITWTAGVPAHSLVNGTGLAFVDVGSGWYLLRGLSETITSGNSHRLELWATDNSASNTGTVSYYVRNHVLLDYVDDYTRYATKRNGYAMVQSGTGVYDAWDVGTNYRRTGTVRWVPRIARDVPTPVSGFVGNNELTCVGCSVQAMVLAGMQMTTMTWVPDRTDCTINQAMYLEAPTWGWSPTHEANGHDLTFPMAMTATTAPATVP